VFGNFLRHGTGGNKMKTKITSLRTPSTKNLYGKAVWMKVRFDDLIQKIEKNKRISKATKKVTLSIDQTEYESIIDCIERARKSIYIKENIKQIKLQNDSLDDEVLKNLIDFRWSQRAIPELGVKPLHYREACERIGLIHPKPGKRASAINKNIKEYYEVAITSFIEKNNEKKPTVKQIRSLIETIQDKFNRHSFESTRKQLSRLNCKHLPRGE
jgi:hypothetical protein